MHDTAEWKVLLVDEDKHNREATEDWLTRVGFKVVAVADVESAVRRLRDGIAVVVASYEPAGMNGPDLLQIVREKAAHVAVILIAKTDSASTAVQAMKEGAFDFLIQPVRPKDLVDRIRDAVEQRGMAAEVATMHAHVLEHGRFSRIIGKSPAIRDVHEKVRRVANVRSTVLITGETGTGKELVAHAIHNNGKRRDKPFIPVNCSALPETLVESELFGHEKGAFTGATEKHVGLFQAANGGTLFIDEIGDMALNAQSKMLRVLETRKVTPVGSTRQVDVDVRVVAATHRNLREYVTEGKFREDLYYRLNVVELKLPPLRERREDVPLLVWHFMEQIVRDNDRPMCDVSPEAMELLVNYDWPGNVRELRNVLEGVIVLLAGDRIEAIDLPEVVRGVSRRIAVARPAMTMQEIEREAMRRTLELTSGNRTEAAKTLGVSVRTLQRKIKEYDLPF